MNIPVSMSLLLLFAIHACLAARLTDDQLEQILSEKIQSPVDESSDYVSLDEINELEKGLAALQKLDDVTGRFYDDDNNAPEDGADKQLTERRGIFNAREEQDIVDKQHELYLNLKIKDRLTGNRYWHFNGINHTAMEMTRPAALDYIIISDMDGSIDNVGPNAEYNMCSQYSHTPSDLSNCLKLSRLRKIKRIDPKLNCVGEICNREVNGFRKRKDKRNVFCSRYSCSNRKIKRVFCNRYGCGRSVRKAKNASQLLLKNRKNNSCNTVVGCRRIKGKVHNMFKTNNDINKQAFEKKTVTHDTNIPYTSRSYSQSTHPRNTFEKLHVKHMKPGDVAMNFESSFLDESADKRDYLRRLISSLCISGRMSCLTDKRNMKIAPRRNKNVFADTWPYYAGHLSALSTEQYFYPRFTKQQTRQKVADRVSQSATDRSSKIKENHRRILHKQAIDVSNSIFGNVCGSNQSCHD